MKTKILLCAFICGCFSSLVAQTFSFEDGKLPTEFSFSPGSHWRVVPQGLAGTRSLCDSVAPHNAAVSESFSYLVPSSPQANADTLSLLLKFTYGTGTTGTTGTNRFGIFVGANLGTDDSMAFTNAKLEAYVLSFKGTGGDDTLRLFYLKNKTLTVVLSTKTRVNNATLAVRLVRSAQGVFALSVGANGSFNNMETYTSQANTKDFAGNYVGAHLVTSTANYRKYLLLDNLSATFSLRTFTPTRYGDVVFSELMVRPSESMELPNEEYIELYNRTQSDIDLSDWTLDYSTKTPATITSGIVRAKNYIVLNAAMAEYGAVANLSVKPSLTDGGKQLTLKDPHNAVVARLSYNATWYGDEAKSEGGFSLEKIDLDNLEESAQNWKATTDDRGGTPAKANAVAAANPDRNAPRCTQYSLARNVLSLTFNEPIAGEELEAQDFRCEPGARVPASLLCSAADPNTLQLVFAEEFLPNTPYTLQVNSGIADFAGNSTGFYELNFGAGVPPQAGEVIINEVLFNPRPGGVDFVELFNISDKLIELQNAKIANRTVATGALGKSYEIKESYVLFPQQYVVLATNPDIVCTHYHCEQPQAVIALATMPPYSNDAGCAALLTASNQVIDEFYYSEKMHISLLNSTKGVSLERINPHRPASEAANWFSASQVAGFATPTYQNSQHATAASGNAQEALSLSPEVFSPDGDGTDDVLFIDYQMPEMGYVANVFIYDATGRLVKELHRNALLGKEGRLLWDGANNAGKLSPIGIYIVLMEAHSQSGTVHTYKKTCTLAAQLR